MKMKEYFHLTLKEVASLQICIWLAIDNPSHIDSGMEDLVTADPDRVVAVENNRKSATNYLSMWQLIWGTKI